MRLKKWTSGLVATSVALGLVPAANAGTSIQADVAARMNRLGIVQGVGVLPNGQPDFNLDGPITRAQLVTTIVRSFGLELAAQASQGAPSFADVPAGEWYSGYVAVAKSLAANKGIAIGRSETVFDPNAPVTKAEALVFVMKFLGYNASGSGANWYEPWLDLARSAGIITASDRMAYLPNPAQGATRGEAFVLLDLGYRAKVLTGGSSLYTQYVDRVAPAISIVQPPTATTQASITVTGSVSDNKGIQTVTLNGIPVTVTNGSFRETINLNPGFNQFVLEATDLAGNVQTQMISITRAEAEAATIEAADMTVGAGQTVPVNAVVKDANGSVIPNVSLNATSTLGTFANGQFTAGSALGSGKLLLQVGSVTKEINVTVAAGPVAQVLPATVGPGGVVKLQATDAFGNPVTSGLTWTLAPGQSGAAISADGTFTGFTAGKYTVIASQAGGSAFGQVGVYGMTTALEVTAPDQVVGNDTTPYKVTVTAVDANGIATPNFDGIISLSAPFGTFTPVMAQNGMATFEFTASSALIGERVNIKASATSGGLSVEGSATVDVSDQVATTIQVEPAAAFLTSNSTSTLLDVTVQVVDQAGAPMREGEFPLTVTLSGPATFEDGTTKQSISWNSFTDPLQIKPTEVGVTGAVTISVSGPGLSPASTQVSARMAGSPKQIMLKANQTKVTANTSSADENEALYFTAFVTDAAGVPVTPDDKDMKVVIEGIATGDLNKHYIAFDTNSNGRIDAGESFESLDVATLTFTDVPDGKLAFWLVGEKAGTYTVSVADAGSTTGLTASAKASYSVVAGAAHHFEGLQGSAVMVRRGAVTPLKYQLVDSFGNPVARVGLTLAFDPTGSNGLKLNGKTTAVSVKTDDAGVATVNLVADTIIDTYGGVPVSIDAAATNTANGWADTAIDWDTAVSSLVVAPGSVEVSLEYDNGSGYVPLVGALPAGTPFRVVATVKDTDGYNLSGIGSSIPVSLIVKTTGETQTNLANVTFSDPDNDGVYQSSDIVITKAGAQGLRVELGNMPQAVSSSQRTINVRAGELSGVKIAESDGTSIKMKADQPKELTIQLCDAYGNPVSGSAVPYPVKFTFMHMTDAGSYTSFRDQDGNELIASGIVLGRGRSSAKFFLRTNQTSGNTITVIVSIDDDNSGTFDGADQVFTKTYTIIPE
jgi:hypothetical protein